MRAFGLAALFLAAGAHACINDRDTLAFEKRNIDALTRLSTATKPHAKANVVAEIALKAISGGFERFPPKYYQMRIDRLEAKPSLTSAEDDDLAVAYERLGRTDKAIQLLVASKRGRKTQDDWYRFHANYGTFLVHRWIASPTRSKDKSDLKESIVQIEKAVAINPDSHFKREKYQLMLEKHWLDPLPGFESEMALEGADAVIGLSGIVMMGLGYELPDIYKLMAHIPVSGLRNSPLTSLANSRALELVATGHGYVSPELASLPTGSKDASYTLLRENGQLNQASWRGFMHSQLVSGMHPDTHPDFWEGWIKPEHPVMKRVGSPGLPAVRDAKVMQPILLGVGGGGMLLVLVLGLAKRLRA